jgi:Ca-activated chloride channel family protein
MVVGHRYFPKESGRLLLTGGKPAQGINEGTVDGTVKDVKNMTSPVLPPEEGKINPVGLTVRINGGADLAGVKSHHHQTSSTKAEDGSLVVKLAEGPVPADRDFELTWAAGRNASTAMLFTEEWQGRHYGLVMIAPPKDITSDVITSGREIIFVLDSSGSMAGRSIRQAKSSLKYALSRLKPVDKFNVIQFNSQTDALFDRIVPANPRNKFMARAYVARLKADGGTEMRSALFAALDGTTKPPRLRQVVFMTDGAVGNERQLFGTIARRLGDARLFTIGIGSAPNRYFMRGAARRGRGTFTFIGSPKQVQTRMKALWQKLSKPVITHITVTPLTESKTETWPNPVPDLFSGVPVYVAVRFSGTPSDVTVTGNSAAGPWRRRLSFAGAKKGKGIAKLWAREKITSLQALRYEGVTPDEIRKQTIAVALAHGLVTRHTSLVALEKKQVRDTNLPLHSRKLPHNLPHGWEYDKVFGGRAQPAGFAPKKAMMDRARRQFKIAGVALKKTPAMKPAKPGQGNAANLQLPQTATPQTIYLIMGLLSLAAALGLFLLGRVRRSHV